MNRDSTQRTTKQTKILQNGKKKKKKGHRTEMRKQFMLCRK